MLTRRHIFICFLLAFLWDASASAVSEVLPIYRFDTRANELISLLHPREIPSSGTTIALASRDKARVFTNLEDVLEYHIVGNNPSSEAAQPVVRHPDYLEGELLSFYVDSDRSVRLLNDSAATHLCDLLDGLASSAPRFSSVLEKALFQRDIYQLFSAIHRHELEQPDQRLRGNAARIASSISALWPRLVLSHAEHAAVISMRPKALDQTRFDCVAPFAPGVDYLPRVVIGPEEGWHELDLPVHATKHFRDFGARSFVRVFVKMPGWSEQEVISYYQKLRREYGRRLTVTSEVPPFPAGTETLLLRTFGVFVGDGYFADTGFPEEVLIRAFKYQTQTFDPETSDWRGTMLFQYKMRRAELLKNPGSLGLHRIGDDSPQFFGFFSEVPDPRNATSAIVTTMRFNCIGCHSELLYGPSTIFSFAIPPTMEAENAEAPWLVRKRQTAAGDLYVNHRSEYRHLVELLAARPQAISPR